VSQTKEGARKVVTKLLQANPDHFREIGRIGGMRGRGHDYRGGFADGEAGRARAEVAGSVGGRISRRRWTPEERRRHSEVMKGNRNAQRKAKV
jgi:hypothetical protein